MKRTVLLLLLLPYLAGCALPWPFASGRESMVPFMYDRDRDDGDGALLGNRPPDQGGDGGDLLID